MQPTTPARIAELISRCENTSGQQDNTLLQEAIELLQQASSEIESIPPEKPSELPINMPQVEKILRGLGHNINGVFATIRGIVEITQLKERNLPDTVNEALLKIDAMIDRGQHTTELTRLYGKVLTCHKNQENLDLLFRRIYNDCKISLCFPVEYHSELNGVTGNVDLFQLENMLPLMVKNSLQAIAQTAPENPSIVLNTRVVGEIQKHLELTLYDNGGGIAEQIRDKIFQPFFSTKPVNKGIGLGLAIVEQIVNNHDGQIHYETDTIGSSLFRIRIPIVN